jgi:hypothetical protein
MSGTEVWLSMVSRWHHREEFDALALALRVVGVTATVGPGSMQFQGDGLCVMMHTGDAPESRVHCLAWFYVNGLPVYVADVSAASPLAAFEAMRATECMGSTVAGQFAWLKGLALPAGGG